MTLLQKYNGLDGNKVSRKELQELADEFRTHVKYRGYLIHKKIDMLLENNPDAKYFQLKISEKFSDEKLKASKAKKGKLTGAEKKRIQKKFAEAGAMAGITPVPAEMLHGLEFYEGEAEAELHDTIEMLNGPVKPEEIYQFITDNVLQVIESGKELPWRKPWKSIQQYGLAASNYASKKAYRGINSMLLNFIYPQLRGEWNIPYFLTFKQIEKYKGKLKKDSKAYRVVYFSRIYQYQNDDEGLKFRTSDKNRFVDWVKDNQGRIQVLKELSIGEFVAQCAIPFLKYYNVFNADDIEGIDWKMTKSKPATEFEAIETAEMIIEAWADCPPITHKGDGAFYIPSKDTITMPPKEAFDSPQEYYGTLFHEMVHSTGHPKRLKRDMSGRMGNAKYAFEELIAELGASFLNAESGILFHTLKNSAAYLKGWRSRLIIKMKNDNKFFFRASSKAQAAADHILQRDEEGMPKYLKMDAEKTRKIKEALDKPKPAKKKATKKPGKKKSMKVDAKGQGVLFGANKQKIVKVPLSEKDKDGRYRYKGFSVMYNSFFKEWQVGHEETGTEGFKSLEDVIDHLTRLHSGLVFKLSAPKKPKQKAKKKVESRITRINKKAKEIRREGEKWQDAQKRATAILYNKAQDNGQLEGPIEDAQEAVTKVSNTVEQVKSGIEKGKAVVQSATAVVNEIKELPKSVLSVKDMLNMKFEKLPFEGKWEKFMQHVPPNLRLIVYGKGKNGKTSFSFQFAQYLSRFGSVLYNLADQGITGTTQDLIKSTGVDENAGIFFSGGRTIDALRNDIRDTDPAFIFVDLMNNYQVDPRTFEDFMKKEFPQKGFILVMEATKGEDFRGEGTWLNIVDAKIFCKDFIAYNSGRLGFGEFIIWPEKVAEIQGVSVEELETDSQYEVREYLDGNGQMKTMKVPI